MITASAPGKLVLFGEFAVLAGHDAWVIAVNRRVRVVSAASNQTDSGLADNPFIVALAQTLAERYGEADVRTVALRHLTIDSSALYDGPTKLGLGSSAAVVAAAAACALAHGPGGLNVGEVRSVARAAHTAGQGGVGSGIDVEAACMGGSLRFRTSSRGPESAPAPWPRDATLLAFHTGTRVDTAPLVAHVARDAHGSLAPALDQLGACAHAALASQNAAQLIAATREALNAQRVLGNTLGVDLITPAVARANSALAEWGAAKGAGAGGDTAFAVVHTHFAEAAAQAITDLGLRLVPLQIERRGVIIESAA